MLVLKSTRRPTRSSWRALMSDDDYGKRQAVSKISKGHFRSYFHLGGLARAWLPPKDLRYLFLIHSSSHPRQSKRLHRGVPWSLIAIHVGTHPGLQSCWTAYPEKRRFQGAEACSTSSGGPTDSVQLGMVQKDHNHLRHLQWSWSSSCNCEGCSHAREHRCSLRCA